MPTQIHLIETPEGPRWDQLKASGLREDFASGFFKKSEPGQPVYVKFNSYKVTWWGDFKTFTFITPEVLVVKWIDPKGQVFWEEEFSMDEEGTRRYESSLPIFESPARNYPGLWQVIIYYKEVAIDQKKFYVMEYNPRDIAIGAQRGF